MVDTQLTSDEFREYIEEKRNWGRWGDDDQLGTINLITADKRRRAASLVRSGRLLSLSRPLPTTPAPNNPKPAHHYMKRIDRPDGGGHSLDYIGLDYHGLACTHLDALCHLWGPDGMWNGHNPDDAIGFDGATYGSVDHWEGIVTRGVLLDVPRHRGTPYVTPDEPVHGSELEAIAKADGIDVEAGDAVAVYCGREAWDRDHPVPNPNEPRRLPGLHGSCIKFFRDTDTAVLLWDMMDAAPSDFGWMVHSAIWLLGLALVDNALLEPLAAACAAEDQYEFQLSLAPLRIIGGTGSPVNPLAML